MVNFNRVSIRMVFRKPRDAGFELVRDHPASLGNRVAHFRLGRSGVVAG